MSFMENEAIHVEVKNVAIKPPCALTGNRTVTVSFSLYAKAEEGRVERAVLSESFEVDREAANNWDKLREQAAGSLSKRLMNIIPDLVPGVTEVELYPGPKRIPVCGSSDS